jgi:hypothetical protein
MTRTLPLTVSRPAESILQTGWNFSPAPINNFPAFPIYLPDFNQAVFFFIFICKFKKYRILSKCSDEALTQNANLSWIFGMIVTQFMEIYAMGFRPG